MRKRPEFKPMFEPPRRCEVDGKPAVFHRWVDEDKPMLHFNTYGHFMSDAEMRKMSHRFQQDLATPHGCTAEIVRQTFALVEYDDGTVRKVEPEKVKFTDRRAE